MQPSPKRPAAMYVKQESILMAARRSVKPVSLGDGPMQARMGGATTAQLASGRGSQKETLRARRPPKATGAHGMLQHSMSGIVTTMIARLKDLPLGHSLQNLLVHSCISINRMCAHVRVGLGLLGSHAQLMEKPNAQVARMALN